ncbi:MAG: hypothetical protein Q8Q52_01400 [Acidimicrobiia bacterium]|nr:hypothetical protein [Acidimicrobiia bacterium]
MAEMLLPVELRDRYQTWRWSVASDWPGVAKESLSDTHADVRIWAVRRRDSRAADLAI